MSRVKITKIKIEMGEQVVALTIDEARALKDSLEKLFGNETKVVEEHHHHHGKCPTYPYIWFESPRVTDVTPRRFGEIWCDIDNTVKISLTT